MSLRIQWSSHNRGFAELYLTLMLFAMVSAAVTVIAQQQIKKIQLEKTAWQMQNQLHHASNLRGKTHDKKTKIKQSLAFMLSPGETIDITSRSNQRQLDISQENIVEGVYDLFHYTSTYLRCGKLEEPLTFILMKQVAYRHQHQHIALRANVLSNNAHWLRSFAHPQQHSQGMWQTDYMHVNTSFTGNALLRDTGWYMRQLLWMEAMHHSEAYSALMPLQLVGAYELLRSATNIAKAPIPKSLNIPIVGKKLKRLFRKGMGTLSEKIFDADAVKPFKKQLKNMTRNKQKTPYNSKACKQLHEQNLYNPNQGKHHA